MCNRWTFATAFFTESEIMKLGNACAGFVFGMALVVWHDHQLLARFGTMNNFLTRQNVLNWPCKNHANVKHGKATNPYVQQSSSAEVAVAKLGNMGNAQAWFYMCRAKVEYQAEAAQIFFPAQGSNACRRGGIFAVEKGCSWFPAQIQPRCLEVSLRLIMRN